MYSGTKSGFFLSILLDEVITKNKTEKEHTITVVYGDDKTSNTDEIRELKKKFSNEKNYDISLDYDSNGFINQVTIYDI